MVAVQPSAPAVASGHHPRPWRRVLWVTGAAVVLGIWFRDRWGGPTPPMIGDDLLQVIAPAAAAAFCVVVGRRSQGSQRRVWMLMGVSSALWALGDGVEGVQQVMSGGIPVASAAVPLYLLSIPFAAASVLAMRREGERPWMHELIDGLFLGASLFVIFWVFLLQPLFHAPGLAVDVKAVDFTYGICDLVMLTLVALALARWVHPLSGGPLVFAAGLVLHLVADSGYIYMTLAGTYGTSNGIDAGWVLGYALIACAPSFPGWSLRPAVAQAPPGRMDSFVPYTGLAGAAGAVVYVYYFGGGIDPVILIAFMALVALALCIQYLAIDQIRRWQRIAERTRVLGEREEWFRSLVQSSSDAILVVDPRGRLTYVSPSAQRVLGVRDEADYRRLIAELDASERAALGAGYQRCLSSAGATASTTLTVSVPARRTYQVTLTNLLHVPSVGGIVLNIAEVTEAAELNRQLAEQALRDPLTGLANRAVFTDRLENAVARHRRRRGPSLAVMCLGLDKFRAVNESVGRAAGDALLQEVARRLLAAARAGDTVARLGGDEFGVVVEDHGDPHGARALAERLAASVAEPQTAAGQQLSLRCSVGIARLDAEGISGDDLLRRADTALSAAKARGGEAVVAFDARLHEALQERMSIQVQLAAALDRGELRVHYQPVLDMRSERIMGVEALVRWEHPVRGMVSPADFVPLAEETGLIVSIGRWVLRQACRDIAAINGKRGQARPIAVSVNVSARQLAHDSLVDDVRSALADSGLAPGTLTLELTESAFIGEVGATRQRLETLKGLGVRVAVDDFGTGFATLSYLKDFPVDVVKIDRSFVINVGRDPGSVALARGIINMSHELGLETVAEGVERLEEAEVLRSLDCDKVQGFLFARPMPLGSLVQLVDRKQPIVAVAS